MNRPNVLFILSDQHNARLAGYAGHPVVQTPALDTLAAEGVSFDASFCNNTICTPSRVSFLSGQYCHNHGYYGLSGPHPERLPSMLSHFRSSGYTTGAIGKMHCPDYWIEDHADTFLEAANSSIGGSPEYEAYLREHELLHLRDDRRYPEHPAMSLDARPSSLEYEHTVDAWISRQCIDFIDSASAGRKPFFLHMSFPHPHQVYAPAREFWDLYPEDRIELPPNGDWSLENKAPHLRAMAEGFATGSWTLFEQRTHEAGRLRKLRGYYGVITQVDRAIGSVIEHLRSNGLLENTIVVYSSDHGEYACEHGILEKAPGICSEAVTRIPMLWRVGREVCSERGDHRRGVTDSLVTQSIDVSATLAELCGVGSIATSDGHSYANHLFGAADTDEPGERSQTENRIALTEAPYSKSITDGRYRLVHYPKAMFRDEYPGGFGELYDRESDPWEVNNLYFEPEFADTVLELRRRLLDTLVTTSRPVTVLPAFRGPGKQRSGNAVADDGKVPLTELEERARSVTQVRNYL